MKEEAILLTDGYKLDHRRQYPEGILCPIRILVLNSK